MLSTCRGSSKPPTRYLEPPEGFEGLVGDDLYEAQAELPSVAVALLDEEIPDPMGLVCNKSSMYN